MADDDKDQDEEQEYRPEWRFHPPSSLRDPYTNDTVELTDDEGQALLGNGGVVTDELRDAADERYREKLADRPFADPGEPRRSVASSASSNQPKRVAGKTSEKPGNK